MSIRSTVIAQIKKVGGEIKKDLPPLTDDLFLVDSGLDSLAIATIVARLEDVLGIDPFTETDNLSYPVTLGDFIRLYENAARLSEVDPRGVQ